MREQPSPSNQATIHAGETASTLKQLEICWLSAIQLYCRLNCVSLIVGFSSIDIRRRLGLIMWRALVSAFWEILI